MLLTNKTNFVLKDKYSVVVLVYLSFQCFNLGLCKSENTLSKADFVLKDQYSVVVYLSFQCFNLCFMQNTLITSEERRSYLVLVFSCETGSNSG